MPPLPNEPWQGTFNATVRGNRCTSIWYDQGIILDGSEDCLSINVQTPITNFEEPVNPDLPVMVRQVFNLTKIFMNHNDFYIWLIEIMDDQI